MKPVRLVALVLALVVAGCSDAITGSEAVSERLDGPSALAATSSGDGAAVQIIHNADDPRARVVDVYIDGDRVLDNFTYRTATGFLHLPAGSYEVAVAPARSRSVRQAIARFDLTLADGARYVVAADGVLPRFRFGDLPGFNLYVNEIGTPDPSADDVAIFAFHGSPDAPPVAVSARNVGTLIAEIAYGDYAGPLTVPAADYTLDVSAVGGSPVVASFLAPLGGLGGQTVTVVASGFLTPPPGPAFGLLAVLADGTVIELPQPDDEEDED